tara:strand:- start:18416 stop:18901 length:486 start_codon:yes stop_codon:yes gene_type:complete
MSNAGNVRAFKADLRGFAKKLNVNLETAVQRLALDAFNRLTKRTPVKTGRARASWTIAIGSPSEAVPPAGKYAKKTGGKQSLTSGFTGADLGSGAAAASDAGGDISAAADIDGKKQVFITSALDYMKDLDNGTSKQAPVGFVEIAMAELEAEIEIILEGLE